jgi:hypothetical protein
LFQRGRDTADEVRLVRDAVTAGRRSGPDPDQLTAGGNGRVVNGTPHRAHAGSPSDRR